MLRPRAQVSEGRLVVRYPVAVVALWIVAAVVGLVFGFASAGGDDPQAGFIGLGLAAICAFVAWFAVRPVIVADRTGIALTPVFGTRTVLRWSEVQAIAVRRVRAARGRGEALMVEASDDREVKVDGLWVGLTASNLVRIASAVEDFAGSIGVTAPTFGAVPEPDPW